MGRLIMDASNLETIMAKHQAKKQAIKERKEEREEAGIVNKLVIERTPNGMYSCHYALRGGIPDELKGWFTRKDRIISIAKQKGIQIEETSIA